MNETNKHASFKKCVYCGVACVPLTRDHVIPKGLYPASKSQSRVQRITVPACQACNRSFSDDEAHFRNALAVAGTPNEAVHELWSGKVLRSIDKDDGGSRLAQLLQYIRPVVINGQHRLAIYPGMDDRVLRVIRKIVRGLSAYHEIEMLVPEERIWTDVLKFDIPSYLYEGAENHHCEKDIVRYSYVMNPDIESSSAWVLTFFDRTRFVAVVEAPK